MTYFLESKKQKKERKRNKRNKKTSRLLHQCRYCGLWEKELRFHVDLSENLWWSCSVKAQLSIESADVTLAACCKQQNYTRHTQRLKERPFGFMLHIIFQQKSEVRSYLFLPQLGTSLLFQAPFLLTTCRVVMKSAISLCTVNCPNCLKLCVRVTLGTNSEYVPWKKWTCLSS